MSSDLLILGFDTSAAHCAAVLLQGRDTLAAHSENMARGQAEHLMPLLEQVLADAGKTWSDIDLIAVGIGPGNFTGIRISVSAARGLALGLGIPARGVSTFDAILELDPQAQPAVLAPRDQIYIRPQGQSPVLVAAETVPGAQLAASPMDLALGIARHAGHGGTTPPAPLYVKPADAAPASDQPPVILDAVR